MKALFFVLSIFLVGCGPRAQNYASYRIPDNVDVIDKNECSLAAKNNKIGQRALNNSRAGKSTTIDSKDFLMISLAVAVAAAGDFVIVPIVIPSTSNPHIDADLARKKYIETCLSKKGYKFDG